MSETRRRRDDDYGDEAYDEMYEETDEELYEYDERPPRVRNSRRRSPRREDSRRRDPRRSEARGDGRRRRPRRQGRRRGMPGWAIVLIVSAAFIPILGMIAAITLPAYQDYVIRTRVAEGLVLASSYKNEVTDYYARHTQWPRGIPEDIARQLRLSDFEATQNVRNIRVLGQGVIEIEYNPVKVSRGGKLLLIPQVDRSNGRVVWRCQNSSGADAFRVLSALPAECRGTTPPLQR